jgi:hypothetical protein
VYLWLLKFKKAIVALEKVSGNTARLIETKSTTGKKSTQSRQVEGERHFSLENGRN